MAKFDDFLAELQGSDPSLILISETWLKPHVPDCVVNIPNYTLYRSDRLEQVSGGVCIYVKEDISEYFAINRMDFVTSSIDALALEIKSDDSFVAVACIYRSRPSTLDENLEFFNRIEELSFRCNILVVVGDFNFPQIT